MNELYYLGGAVAFVSIVIVLLIRKLRRMNKSFKEQYEAQETKPNMESIGKRERIRTIRTGGRTATLIQATIIGGVLALVLTSYIMINAYPVEEDAPQEVVEKALQRRNAGMLVIMLLGSFAFAPIGIFFGWIMVDPYQRARAKRMILKKNYGIVNFVSRGNKIISKIKDFDKDLLFVNNGVWILEPNKVYRLSKDDTSTEEEKMNPIQAKHIHTIIGIPVLFLDIDTMRPLSMFKDMGDANPIDLASTLKGYIMNQLAKNMFFKRTFTAISLISIVLLAVNLYFTYEIYNVAMDLEELLPKLDALANRMDALIKAGQTTIEQGAG